MKQEYEFKVVVLGDTSKKVSHNFYILGVGKTSVLNRFISDKFSAD
jgi:GTPase SAR1 family protein